MNQSIKRDFLYSFFVSWSGLLFGFDTIVISGVEQGLQVLWETSDFFHGSYVIAMALWGTVIGAVLGSWPTNKYGRKKTLILVGFFFFVSAVGSALANDPISFGVYRFLGGLGIGVSTIVAPAYIAEISPRQNRGKRVAMYQLSIVIGILIAMISNYFLQSIEVDSWRWMLGVEVLPAIVFVISMFYIPNSPRWLMMKGDVKTAEATIELIQMNVGIDDIEKELHATSKRSMYSLLCSKYQKSFYLVILIALFNQFSGINGILYYAPRIFEEAGFGKEFTFLNGIGIGLINLLATIVGMSLIDSWGRKKLLYLGSFGYIFSLSLISIAFFCHWNEWVILVSLLLFIAAHAIGQGAVIWVFIAELFPTQLRALGQSIGSTVHWVLAALIPSFIPLLFATVGAGVVFGFFALMMLFQLFWIFRFVPETSKYSLEEIGKINTQ